MEIRKQTTKASKDAAKVAYSIKLSSSNISQEYQSHEIDFNSTTRIMNAIGKTNMINFKAFFCSSFMFDANLS